MPVGASGVRLCGEGNDLIAVDATGTELGRRPIEPGLDGNRINEGKPDPQGRIWFGIDVEDAPTRTGCAVPVRRPWRGPHPHDHDRQRHRLGRRPRADVSRRLADTADRRRSITTSPPARSRTYARGRRSTPPKACPTGSRSTARAASGWRCSSGGAVRRFDPDGETIGDIELPTPFVTCPAFGGDDLSTLFVTSSQHKIPLEERGRRPARWCGLHDRSRRLRTHRQPGRHQTSVAAIIE